MSDRTNATIQEFAVKFFNELPQARPTSTLLFIRGVEEYLEGSIKMKELFAQIRFCFGKEGVKIMARTMRRMGLTEEFLLDNGLNEILEVTYEEVGKEVENGQENVAQTIDPALFFSPRPSLPSVHSRPFGYRQNIVYSPEFDHNIDDEDEEYQEIKEVKKGKEMKRKKANRWSPEESKLLEELVKESDGKCRWKIIAEKINEQFNGNKTAQQAAQHYNRSSSSSKFNDWTIKEEKLLLRGVKIYGTKWAMISSQYLSDRSDVQCRYHYNRYFLKPTEFNEDNLELLRSVSSKSKISWERFAHDNNNKHSNHSALQWKRKWKEIKSEERDEEEVSTRTRRYRRRE